MRIKIFIVIFILILPLVLTIPSIVYLFDNSLVLFPNPRYATGIESTASLNSSIEDFYFDSRKLSLSFILRKWPSGGMSTYASLAIWLKRENNFIDLSSYDHLFLEIEKATPARVVIFIKTFEKGVSKPEKEEAVTLRHNEYTLSFAPGVTRYNINIDDFATPDWWFNLLKVPGDKRNTETYSKVSALDFQFIHRGVNPPEEKKEEFVATKIAVGRSYPVFYIILDIIAALYCIFLIAAIRAKKKRIASLVKDYFSPPVEEIPYKHLVLENYADKELERIVSYLREHYNDSKISSSLISSETGIPRSHITELMKKHHDCTCKQMINRIRITEAKRLLKKTDRRILEVALEVGFEDISTFNRCFKQIEGVSPRQFRTG